jgi:menaquinol-cytochrome c reductase cytochrome b/c subunit
MAENKDFVAALDSDAKRTPVRVAFVTRRVSPQVKAQGDQYVMTFPEAIFRAAVAIEIVAIVLVLLSLFFDAPLEGLADPMQTPNPAKAPWYFLGLQELLHYFPPVIAGVLIPGMLVMALIVIPYFNINVEAEGVWRKNRRARLQIAAVLVAALAIFLLVFDVVSVLIPTLLIAGFMFWSAWEGGAPGRFRRWLQAKPISFWIMTWFLLVAAVLTVIGTFFRGAGWAWVWPWGPQ